jgi:tellurite resistance protein
MTPMHPENVAIVKALVSVAWADGEFRSQEKEMLDALLEAFGANDDQTKSLRAYAETKRSLDDVPIEDLSSDDVRVLINHAVLLTFVDGQQDPVERKFVENLASFLGIPDAEVTALMAAAEDRAKSHLDLLKQ